MRDLRRSTVADASSEQTMRLLLLLRRLPAVLIGLVGHDQRTCSYVARLWSVPSAR